MYILEYSTCKRIDGIEEWEDAKHECETLEQVDIIRECLRRRHAGSYIIFGDVINR